MRILLIEDEKKIEHAKHKIVKSVKISESRIKPQTKILEVIA